MRSNFHCPTLWYAIEDNVQFTPVNVMAELTQQASVNKEMRDIIDVEDCATTENIARMKRKQPPVQQM